MKRMKWLLWLVVVAMLVAPGASVYAAGYDLAGVGAKALAMGGAFRGIADDWSAMYWNPAGLAGQGTSVHLGVKSLFPTVWVTPRIPGEIPSEPFYGRDKISSRDKIYPAGGASFIYQFDPKLSAGLAIFAPSALGAVWNNLTLGPPNGYNNTVAWPKEDYSSNMAVIDIHPTVGYKITDHFRAGLGVSIYYATITMQTPARIPTGAPMPYQNFFVLGKMEGSGMGYGFNLGLLYDVTDKLHVGVSYKGQAELDLSGTMKQTLYLPYNPALGDLAGDPAHFNGGTMKSEPDAEAKFPVPMEAGIGFAYNVTDRLTLAADASWTNWSHVDIVMLDVTGKDPNGQPAEDQELKLKYKDTIRYNVGLNYVVMPENGFQVRAGYYFDPSAVPTDRVDPTITDNADKHNISIGAAINVTKKLEVAGVWEHLITNSRYAKPYYEDGELANFPGYWKLQVDTFTLQFTYRF